MPSLARVMPAISLFMSCFLFCLLARRAFLGVAVAVILEYLLHDFGLEFPVRSLGHLGQVEVLDRIAVGVEFECTAQRSEISLLQRGRNLLLVAKVALDSPYGAIDQHCCVIGLHGIATGYDAIGCLVGGY